MRAALLLLLVAPFAAAAPLLSPLDEADPAPPGATTPATPLGGGEVATEDARVAWTEEDGVGAEVAPPGGPAARYEETPSATEDGRERATWREVAVGDERGAQSAGVGRVENVDGERRVRLLAARIPPGTHVGAAIVEEPDADEVGVGTGDGDWPGWAWQSARLERRGDASQGRDRASLAGFLHPWLIATAERHATSDGTPRALRGQAEVWTGSGEDPSVNAGAGRADLEEEGRSRNTTDVHTEAEHHTDDGARHDARLFASHGESASEEGRARGRDAGLAAGGSALPASAQVSAEDEERVDGTSKTARRSVSTTAADEPVWLGATRQEGLEGSSDAATATAHGEGAEASRTRHERPDETGERVRAASGTRAAHVGHAEGRAGDAAYATQEAALEGEAGAVRAHAEQTEAPAAEQRAVAVARDGQALLRIEATRGDDARLSASLLGTEIPLLP